MKTRTLWVVWIALSAMIVIWLGLSMLKGDDKTIFMPGPLTGGHHQLGLSCESCHTDPLGAGEVLQKACIDCHGDVRKKPFDSHPRAKFEDPRNADQLENIDALQCITCHTEHKPEITTDNGLTQPRDFCIHCHESIGEERSSHKDMKFDTCASSGCHNFHNNRALYTDFLLKHLHEPEQLEKQLIPEREYSDVLDQLADYPIDRYPVKQLSKVDADAPEVFNQADNILHDWSVTAHAKSGVNCSACHMKKVTDSEELIWEEKPDQTICGDCHQIEIERFQSGKHGMRLAAGLPPMKPSDARLPMHKKAAHKELTCNSCHTAHRYDATQAAVNSCMECHNDTHTLAYKESPHYQLWQSELDGRLPGGSGVSCATCHMPRINFDVSEWMSRIIVDHNQNANLSPNSKMLRTTCMHCHGLEFSIDSLADRKLIERNFAGMPSIHVQTMELAEQDLKRALSEGKDGSQH